MKSLVEKLWVSAYLRQIARVGGTRLGHADLHREQARYEARGLSWGRDEGFAKTLATTVLASASALENEYGCDRAEAVAVVQKALRAVGRRLTYGMTRAWLWSRRDPFGDLEKVSPLDWMRRMWGNALKAEQHCSEGRIELTVTDCAFRDYFWQAGRSDLTPVLCSFDAMWHDVINHAKRGMIADQMAAMGEGARTCRFTYSRVLQMAESAHGKPLSNQRNLL
ncbi:L-2-amino-thiazoline-4-carboxylic acid hydrolase [Marivita hallyeonensis]|uniref:L-2-amino-thiazoline-4-carboxylic acid hydrolase n=1 Tax=Marivita hallyeonensis TaxID=996342 RepID=A0A1M5TDU4_9RHOB|nr:L-2-amino-thiazoline-4-carboxylic acid hydrolase [Marivita hallyeonensis]SHH48851.1 L-2-amino-thiazoline-4-carboxylic acid hydrolase [Marivita hallyeonensis]